jgi:hypothetical protein
MKKGWLFLLLVLFPISVNAQDKIIIDNYDAYVSVLGENSYYFYNTFNTKIIYEKNNLTNYIEISIPNDGPYEYKNKIYNYSVELNNMNFITEHENFRFANDEHHIFIVGSDKKFLKEKDNIKFSYNIKQEGEKLKYTNDLYFILADSKYEINNVTFKIVLPENNENYIIKFSIDGINYYRSLEHLEYNQKDNIINGEYLYKLDPENKIYVKLESNKINIDDREVVVYVSLISVLVTIIYVSNSKLLKKS